MGGSFSLPKKCSGAVCHLCLLATRERRWHAAAAASRDGGVVDYDSSTRSGSWGWKDESLQQLWGGWRFCWVSTKTQRFWVGFCVPCFVFFPLRFCILIVFFCVFLIIALRILEYLGCVCTSVFGGFYWGHSNPSKSERQVKIQPFSQQWMYSTWIMDVQHLDHGCTAPGSWMYSTCDWGSTDIST